MEKSQLRKIIKEEISNVLNEGALMEQGGWNYNLLDQIEDKVEELNSIIGKYDNEEIINLINKIIRDLEELKMKKSELRKIIKEEITKVLAPGESFSDFQKTDRNPNYDFPTFESIQRTNRNTTEKK